MIRTPRTLLSSVAAIAALATAAIAAPTPPTSDDATGGMVGMHATGTTEMHTAGAGMAGMAGMHAAMLVDPAIHGSRLDDPTMQAHMGEYGVDADQMRRWHEAGGSVDEMHERLVEQDVDMDAMQADCPMIADGSMASMHGDGGRHPGGHHTPKG